MDPSSPLSRSHFYLRYLSPLWLSFARFWLLHLSFTLGPLCEYRCKAGMRAAGLCHSHMIHSQHISFFNIFFSFSYFPIVCVCFVKIGFLHRFCICSLACCLFKQICLSFELFVCVNDKKITGICAINPFSLENAHSSRLSYRLCVFSFSCFSLSFHFGLESVCPCANKCIPSTFKQIYIHTSADRERASGENGN